MAKRSDYFDLELYFERGLCPEFFSALRSFAYYVFKKHAFTKGDFRLYYEDAQGRVVDRILSNTFDPKKGNFKSYVYALLRNECSCWNHRNKKLQYIDNLELSDTREMDIPKLQLFFDRCRKLSIPVNPDSFELEMQQRKFVTPMVFAFAWLMYTDKL